MKNKTKTTVRIVSVGSGFVAKFKHEGKLVTVRPNKKYAYATYKNLDSAQRNFRKVAHTYGMKSGSWTYQTV